MTREERKKYNMHVKKLFDAALKLKNKSEELFEEASSKKATASVLEKKAWENFSRLFPDCPYCRDVKSKRRGK